MAQGQGRVTATESHLRHVFSMESRNHSKSTNVSTSVDIENEPYQNICTLPKSSFSYILNYFLVKT